MQAEQVAASGLKLIKSDLPKGFTSTENGIYYKGPDDKEPTFVAPPIEVIANTRDELSSSWGLLVRWKDPDGKIHDWIIPYSLLAGKDTGWLSVFADGGYLIESSTRFNYFLTLYKTNQRVICVQNTGWNKDNAFVFPDTVLYVGSVGNGGNSLITDIPRVRQGLEDVGVERLMLQTQVFSNPYLFAGTLEEWKNTIGTWSNGNSILILAVCCAFAAALIKLLDHENFGINFIGKSSSGKSTSLQAGCSVWGKGSTGQGGYAMSWNSTTNGLEGIAMLHNDTLLALDEMGQASGRTVNETTYMLSNGVGKTRSRRDGTAKAPRKWRCVVLSTGEKGVAEKISDDGKQAQAGQLVRIVDIPADAGVGLGVFEDLHGHASAQTFADTIKQAAMTHYGHAAREFIKLIQENISWNTSKN